MPAENHLLVEGSPADMWPARGHTHPDVACTWRPAAVAWAWTTVVRWEHLPILLTIGFLSDVGEISQVLVSTDLVGCVMLCGCWTMLPFCIESDDGQNVPPGFHWAIAWKRCTNGPLPVQVKRVKPLCLYIQVSQPFQVRKETLLNTCLGLLGPRAGCELGEIKNDTTGIRWNPPCL